MPPPRCATRSAASFSAMRALRADPSAANATAARNSIGQLAATMRTHLAHEERDLEPFAARKAHKHGTGTFFAWLMDGAGPDVTTALRRELPPVVLLAYRRVAGRRYNPHIATVWT